MGNNNSQPQRPPNPSRVSASSTATLKAVNGREKRHSRSKRKSLELPDLDSSLAFTKHDLASPSEGISLAGKPVSPSHSRSPTRSTPWKNKGKAIASTAVHSTSPDWHQGIPQRRGSERRDSILFNAVTPVSPSSADRARIHSLRQPERSSPTKPLFLEDNSMLIEEGTTPQLMSIAPLKQPVNSVLAPVLPTAVPVPIPAVPPVTPPIPAEIQPIINAGIITTSSAANTPPLETAAWGTATPITELAQNALPAAAPILALQPTLVSDPAAQEAVQKATVDLGAGSDAVTTLLTWKADELSNSGPGKETHEPSKVYVTGTFANKWQTKIEMRRNQDITQGEAPDFTALVALPPGQHTLKFIVDDTWKTSKYLPSATDTDGNLINYLQVNKVDPHQAANSVGRAVALANTARAYNRDFDEGPWVQDIPHELELWGYQNEIEQYHFENYGRSPSSTYNSAPHEALPLNPFSTVNRDFGGNSAPAPGLPAHLHQNPKLTKPLATPHILPATLEKGILNHSSLVAKGSGDDNSILPKPDHSVLNHLAASPIKNGLIQVAVTTRYRRKYVTTIYLKPMDIEHDR